MVKGEQISFFSTKNPNESPIPLHKAITKSYQEIEKQNTQKQHDYIRKPLQDITNTIQHQSDYKKKSEKIQTQPKLTNKYAHLTFLNRTAEKKYRTLLFIDRELNFPQEYLQKFQVIMIQNQMMNKYLVLQINQNSPYYQKLINKNNNQLAIQINNQYYDKIYNISQAKIIQLKFVNFLFKIFKKKQLKLLEKLKYLLQNTVEYLYIYLNTIYFYQLVYFIKFNIFFSFN
ncbi:transmembrane protein, putative (macronuclear) [Tetrahymena thermophila SB210]|uniref:Transmembrane protein, putative n=1 Tax=Tetrahymena thermophila (strain SB210) TaxID=312017 RepID=W7WXX0_TETTS|nr:transmembrane protein, putative [Tetrahymena thermophila SB210]EWS71695.1 transmembrane protein, putative [Tetrahymena thermophila SB210]|eukprot:XP_012655767.1 transmembrane protein, putative [Tetrahymena thermophila SB210]